MQGGHGLNVGLDIVSASDWDRSNQNFPMTKSYFGFASTVELSSDAFLIKYG